MLVAFVNKNGDVFPKGDSCQELKNIYETPFMMLFIDNGTCNDILVDIVYYKICDEIGMRT